MVKIKDKANFTVEQHETPRMASYAYWVLCAHERKNNRVPEYRLEQAGVVVEPLPADQFDFPSWMDEALATVLP